VIRTGPDACATGVGGGVLAGVEVS
jgi:hypothetical protein